MAAGAREVRAFGGDLWREATSVHPDPGGARAAFRVAIAVTVPLAAIYLSGHPELTAYAAFGSLSSVYGKKFDYRDRLVAGLGAGAMLVLAVEAGTLAGIIAAGSLVSVIVMMLVSILGVIVSRWRGWLPIPSLFLVFASGTIGSVPHHPRDLLIGGLIAVAAAVFGVLLGQLGRMLPARYRRQTTVTPTVVPLRALAASHGIGSQVFTHGAGPLIAGALALACSIGHPYWAAVSATVPLVGRTVAAQFARGVLRMLGTFVGVGVAFALISLEPPSWVLLIATAICQTLTELLVARNYGLAVIFITPLALIMSHLAAPIAIGPLAVDRIVETIIGVCVSIALLLIVRMSAKWMRR